MCSKTLAFLVLALLGVASAKNIAFEECEGEAKAAGVVTKVDVTPCEKEPCEIPRGASALITVSCTPELSAQKLRLTVWASIEGIELPYPGMKRDACKGKNITCPVAAQQPITYVQKFDVKKFFPKVETKAKFKLAANDGQDQMLCCFVAPVKVVDSVE